MSITARIDSAIERLRSKFSDSNANHILLAISIENLKEKRHRVIAGTYSPDEDAERVTALFQSLGAGICENVKSREPWYETINL